ncbi:SigB/SigF/SigG family RNA polymerase sigma factor [Pseudonocardia sp. TRM90224]|uniref:SigB/SigF/SigG family RNA polymerase sigma factor n=1 Tax=Pseudonocardia sp. TRM90224 TaxID=2812678 RepID=UPI0027E075F5|nr:SigB/SigF/SigG family RNA polymerase sigma factor [Pseudonocardia sp. TRM90224]
MSSRAADKPSVRDDYAHLAPLLEQLAEMSPDDPDRRAVRDKLVTGYLPVVQHIARRFAGRGQPTDDLEQAGTIGLIGAVDRFEPGRGSDFLAFAIPTITGETRRYFRDHTWMMRVPRRLRDLQSSVHAATDTLSHELGRAPRPSELAARLDLTVDEVLEALDAANAYRAGSLDMSVVGVDAALGEIVGVADREMETVEFRHSLAPLLDRLPERERTIIVLRFFGEMTQTQIAHRVGLSQMHVSRLLAQTLDMLRRNLTEGFDAQGLGTSPNGSSEPARRRRDHDHRHGDNRQGDNRQGDNRQGDNRQGGDHPLSASRP